MKLTSTGIELRIYSAEEEIQNQAGLPTMSVSWRKLRKFPSLFPINRKFQNKAKPLTRPRSPSQSSYKQSTAKKVEKDQKRDKCHTNRRGLTIVYVILSITMHLKVAKTTNEKSLIQKKTLTHRDKKSSKRHNGGMIQSDQ